MTTTRSFRSKWHVEQPDDLEMKPLDIEAAITAEMTSQIVKELDYQVLFSIEVLTCTSAEQAFAICDKYDRSLTEFLMNYVKQRGETELYQDIKAFVDLGGK